MTGSWRFRHVADLLVAWHPFGLFL